ncbi:hypothetical protein ABEY65_28135 [Priestia aryabhattai]|uniref:hypothetical protein n=1 Tax=Priestia aryabhattai TaxID=412384 RepID=UPI003D2DEE75
MRIVTQGSMTATQLGKVINEILSNTLGKLEAKGKRQPIHNAVVEFTLNLQGYDEPQLIVVDEGSAMLTIHTGVKNGELVEYVPVDRQELLDKFDRMVEEETKQAEAPKKEDDVIDAEFTEVE